MAKPFCDRSREVAKATNFIGKIGVLGRHTFISCHTIAKCIGISER